MPIPEAGTALKNASANYLRFMANVIYMIFSKHDVLTINVALACSNTTMMHYWMWKWLLKPFGHQSWPDQSCKSQRSSEHIMGCLQPPTPAYHTEEKMLKLYCVLITKWTCKKRLQSTISTKHKERALKPHCKYRIITSSVCQGCTVHEKK